MKLIITKQQKEDIRRQYLTEQEEQDTKTKEDMIKAGIKLLDVLYPQKLEALPDVGCYRYRINNKDVFVYTPKSKRLAVSLDEIPEYRKYFPMRPLAILDVFKQWFSSRYEREVDDVTAYI